MASPEDPWVWCSIYGDENNIPGGHVCTVAICYNPYRDGMTLEGTLEERKTKAQQKLEELRNT